MSAEFGAAPRTVDDYIARARDRFAIDSAGTAQEERGTTLTRLDKLARKLEAQGAWSALVNVERLLADVRGLRRGTVTVEAAVTATQQPFPEVSLEECIEECFLAVEAVASSWDNGTVPKPSAARIARVSAPDAAYASARQVTTQIARRTKRRTACDRLLAIIGDKRLDEVSAFDVERFKRRAGAGLDVVADVLGHATLTMARRYAHLGKETMRAAMAALPSPVAPMAPAPKKTKREREPQRKAKAVAS